MAEKDTVLFPQQFVQLPRTQQEHLQIFLALLSGTVHRMRRSFCFCLCLFMATSNKIKQRLSRAPKNSVGPICVRPFPACQTTSSEAKVFKIPVLKWGSEAPPLLRCSARQGVALGTCPHPETRGRGARCAYKAPARCCWQPEHGVFPTHQPPRGPPGLGSALS